MDYFHADRDRYGRDHRAERFPAPSNTAPMAAQLTYRESLRDIETCAGPRRRNSHMGFRPAGPALDAGRCQRKARLAYPCGVGASHHPGEDAVRRPKNGVGPDQYRHALDSTTIALCLSVFPWAHFRTTKAAVKMHTRCSTAGQLPSFIHIVGWRCRRSCPRYALAEAGAIYVVDRGYVDFAAFMLLHQAGAFARAKSNIDAHRVYSAPTDRSTGIICDQTISPGRLYTRQDYPGDFCGASASRTPSPPRRWSSSPGQLLASGRHHLRRSTKAAGRWNSSSSGSSRLFGSRFYGTSENAVKTQIWIAVSVYVGAMARSASTWTPRLHFVTDR